MKIGTAVGLLAAFGAGVVFGAVKTVKLEAKTLDKLSEKGVIKERVIASAKDAFMIKMYELLYGAPPKDGWRDEYGDYIKYHRSYDKPEYRAYEGYRRYHNPYDTPKNEMKGDK